MSVKLVVLYPYPTDKEAFEQQYVGQHLPLMRELLGPDVPLPTFRLQDSPERLAPYYRMSEIHFRDQQHFTDFVQSGKSKIGRDSSVKVSTGGKPVFFVCTAQQET